tara:strand:- start:191 stop:436 length:246 start_codon:yes stop_codon:yes gene_type:complete
MKNEDILSKETQADTLNKLTQSQTSMIDDCMSRLKSIKDSGKVTERNLRELTSILRELDSLRELFYLLMFNSLKRGDMLLG